MPNSRLMKNICCIAFALLLFPLACKQKSLPPDIWEKEQMTEFLFESLLLEAKVSIQELSKEQRDSLCAHYYEELFSCHNTTREIWGKNMNYYRDKQKEIDDIYKEIITRLTLLENTKQHLLKNTKETLKQKNFFKSKLDIDSLKNKNI